MNKKKSIIALIILLLIIPTITSLVNIQDSTDTVSSSEDNQGTLINDFKKPKSSGALDYREIWIDDRGVSPGANGTWLWAETQPWCTDVYGDNSLYLIEDITLTNPDNVGSPLLIGNSTLRSFIIQNCTLTNAANINGAEAGVALYNVTNGQILDCDISNNQGQGIFMTVDCKNNLIKNNTIDNNNNFGMRIQSGCNDNDIINNTISDFHMYGIQSTQAYRTVIENNTIDGTNTGDDGIYLASSTNANIKNNTIFDCTDGIHSASSDDANITLNTIKDCTNGIYLEYTNNKILSGNKMVNCGILLWGNSEPDMKSGAIYTNNTVNGKPIYFYADQNGLDTNNFTSDGAPGQILLVNCAYSTISNFNISDTSVGIQLCYSEHNNISSNSGRNNYRGIILHYYNDNNTIFNNTITYSRHRDIELYFFNDNNTIIENLVRGAVIGLTQGISLDYYNDDNEITKNRVLERYAGIHLLRSDYNNITHNIVKENSNGIYLNWDSVHNFVYNNTCNDNEFMGILLENNANDNTILENNCTETADGDVQDVGIYVVDNCLRNDIINNTINNNLEYGIYMTQDCAYNNISYNDVRFGTLYGIYVISNCDNNTFFRNNISANDKDGFWIEDCLNNTILENEIRNNNEIGIGLRNSNETYIARNDVIHNGYAGDYCGIDLEYSYFNNITDNSIIDNDCYGIVLIESDNNNISRNVIRENLESGILIYSNSDDNLIFLNFFKDNPIWHVEIEAGCTGNKLNNSFIGNWWDNYTGVDTTPTDGIGDYSHPVPEGYQDYLPIFDDTAPVITIIDPIASLIINDTAPGFNVSYVEKYLYKMWYSLDNGITNVTFTKNGTIDQELWIALPNGYVYLRFWIEDKTGKIGTDTIKVIKNRAPSSAPIAGDDDDDDDDDDDTGVVVVVVIIIVIASVGAGVGVVYVLIQKGIIDISKLKKR